MNNVLDMSDTDNNEYMKIDELSGKLKEGLLGEFSCLSAYSMTDEFGFPATVGLTLVAASIAASIAPAPGSCPLGVG